MERRDVLRLGALASVGSGCASLLSNPAGVGAGEIEGFLSALDGAMASAASSKTFEQFLPADGNPEHTARVRNAEELTKKTLRSLLLVGTLSELSPGQLQHEGVQQRLRDSMGEFDDAMFGMTAMLEGLAPTERATASKALRDDPGLGMRIMGGVDEEAAAFGVSLKQRTKLRAISAEACARLRQSPDLAIAEYTGKMRKIEARHGARAEAERKAAAAFGSALLWQGEESVNTEDFHPVVGGVVEPTPDAGVSEAPELPPIPGDPPRPPDVRCRSSADCVRGQECGGYRKLDAERWAPGTCQVTPKRERRRVSPFILSAGGVALGVGATLFFLTLGGGLGVALFTTIGAILGVAGVVMVIVGLALVGAGR